MSKILRDAVYEEPRLMIVRWYWSDDWYSLVPWALDGVNMPYIGKRVKDYGDGRVLTFRTIGPLAIARAEIVTKNG